MEGTVIIAWILLDLDKTVSLDWIFSIRYFVVPIRDKGVSFAFWIFPRLPASAIGPLSKMKFLYMQFPFCGIPPFQKYFLALKLRTSILHNCLNSKFFELQKSELLSSVKLPTCRFRHTAMHSSTFKGRKTCFNGNIPILRFRLRWKSRKNWWLSKKPYIVDWRPDFFETICQLLFFVLIQKYN